MEAVTTNYPDEIISAGQLLRILDSDAKEISTLCQRACLKPKKDGFGNIYFSKGDVDVLRKVKELYEQTRRLQEEKRTKGNLTSNPVSENRTKKVEAKKPSMSEIKTEKKPSVNFLNIKNLPQKPASGVDTVSLSNSVAMKMENFENNVVKRISDVLSEKLDGLDEVIVELIRAKTENENLRQKINELNKENFSLKSENASYKSVGLGFYIKKSTDDFSF